MQRAISVLGVLLLLAGGLWALQGAGVVMWPASSFMLRQQSWVYYGVGTMALGALLLIAARRR